MQELFFMYFFAGGGLAVVLVAFLVISKTLTNVGVLLLRMEYLLSREYELVKEKERVKKKIADQDAATQQRQAQRHMEHDPLLRVPYMTKKDKK